MGKLRRGTAENSLHRIKCLIAAAPNRAADTFQESLPPGQAPLIAQPGFP